MALNPIANLDAILIRDAGRNKKDIIISDDYQKFKDRFISYLRSNPIDILDPDHFEDHLFTIATRVLVEDDYACAYQDLSEDETTEEIISSDGKKRPSLLDPLDQVIVFI